MCMKFQGKETERLKPMNLRSLSLPREVKLGLLDSAAWIDISSRAMKMALYASGMQRAANSTTELQTCTKRKLWICNSAQIEHTLSLHQETSLQR